MTKRLPKKIAIEIHPDDGLEPGKTQLWRNAGGKECKRHSAIHRCVSEDKKRCRQCDQEAGDKEVKAVVEKIQRERETATATPRPFAFIDEKSLAAMFGDKAAELTPIIQAWEQARKEWYRQHTISPCTEPVRWKLRDERKSITHHFEIGDENDGGVSAYIAAGMFSDHKIGEVFIKAAKMGGYVSGFTDAFATTLSFLFQHGATLKEIVEKFAHQSFEPSGFIRGSPKEIRKASSVIDYCVRWLDLRFPGGYLAQEFRDQAVVGKV